MVIVGLVVFALGLLVILSAWFAAGDIDDAGLPQRRDEWS